MDDCNPCMKCGCPMDIFDEWCVTDKNGNALLVCGVCKWEIEEGDEK